MEKTLIKELSQLNKNEKMLLVEALWDSIASDPDQIEIPAHHKSVLEERLKTFEQDKLNGASWQEIRQKYI
jgi:putative addiction module component (TIGR02574 family)